MLRKNHLKPVLLACALLLAACANTGDEARSASAGCLVAPPEEPVACTMQYDPVCGCDGKTYSNACVARANGIPRSTPGACGDSRHD